MVRFKRILMRLMLGLIVLFAGLSVYSAFIGPAAAKELFGSSAMLIFWGLSLICIFVCLVLFPQLTRRPPLALIHIGALLIILGGLWSSEQGHSIQRNLLKNAKYQTGELIVEKGKMQNIMAVQNYSEWAWLPFYLALEDFTIKHYEPADACEMPVVRQYLSSVKIIEQDQVVSSKQIRVNKPLRYGGYYFLQQDWGLREGNPYSVFTVVSDSGIGLIFGGYIFLGIGLFWSLWSKAFKRI
ncbi:MAG: cytochrome c biogenesis protein ResB [Phycisphaerae bacterium]